MHQIKRNFSFANFFQCSTSADCDNNVIPNDPDNQKKNTVCKTAPTDAAKTDLGKCISCSITSSNPEPQGTDA